MLPTREIPLQDLQRSIRVLEFSNIEVEEASITVWRPYPPANQPCAMNGLFERRHRHIKIGMRKSVYMGRKGSEGGRKCQVVAGLVKPVMNMVHHSTLLLETAKYTGWKKDVYGYFLGTRLLSTRSARVSWSTCHTVVPTPLAGGGPRAKVRTRVTVCNTVASCAPAPAPEPAPRGLF